MTDAAETINLFMAGQYPVDRQLERSDNGHQLPPACGAHHGASGKPRKSRTNPVAKVLDSVCQNISSCESGEVVFDQRTARASGLRLAKCRQYVVLNRQRKENWYMLAVAHHHPYAATRKYADCAGIYSAVRASRRLAGSSLYSRLSIW
jgi:hypothetical protein